MSSNPRITWVKTIETAGQSYAWLQAKVCERRAWVAA